MAEQAGPERSHPSTTRRVCRRGVLSLVLVVVVVAIFYFVFKRIDFAQVWTQIRAMTWGELATLGLAAVWNLAAYVFVWVAVTPGLSYLQAFTLTQSRSATERAAIRSST
jgi:putative heme transporter